MKKIFLFAIYGAIALLVVWLVFIVMRHGVDSKSQLTYESDDHESKGVHKAYYTDESFYGNLELFRQVPFDEKIYGSIVSHHFLMVREIANLISRYVEQGPETIFIIGPNHFNAGDANVLISEFDYDTPWGLVYNDREKTRLLVQSGVVKNNEKPFGREHSISSLVGFIKYYLPNTKIVPIILKKNVTEIERRELAKELNEIVREDDILLASVDFSHHINAVASDFHDKRTISVIENFDHDRLLSVEVDSAETLDVFLDHMEVVGAKKMYGLNTNMSERLEDSYIEDGTSYLFAHFVKGEKKTEKKVSLLSFGDLMLGRDVKNKMQSGLDPFEKIQGMEGNFLKGVDLISANLEGPITEMEECNSKKFSFKFDPSIVELFEKYHFNVFNLANNHTYDCFSDGLADTKNILEQNDLFYFGDSKENALKVKEIADKKIVFVGIDATIAYLNESHIKKVMEARRESDIVVVNVHWGEEYKRTPNEKQVRLAHDLIDSGADVIIGHHPHVVQSGEIYKNKPIFYSLGNFVFDQFGVEENRGIGVGMIFGGEFTEYYLFPYNIVDYQPELMKMEESDKYCARFMGTMQVESKGICQFSL